MSELEDLSHDLEEVDDHLHHPIEPCYETYEVLSDIKQHLVRQLGRIAEGANNARL